ncbi:YbhN family protein [Haliscomenobacter sp.]|uniref:lysylphosphatidylglycerol synthase transmembrane domain-containing protein n=1 Tax=Haliscomenobacter sp. TaxID=2717303 RepID=UPI003593E225
MKQEEAWKDTEKDQHKALKSISPYRIVIPALLGLAGVFYMLWRNFDLEEFKRIQWTGHVYFWIGMGILTIVIRDLSYALRLRALTNKELSWWKCIEVVIIWEFSSAVSPSALGGSAVAFFILSQEKLSVARTVTIVTYTIVLDALFMLCTLPILFLIFGFDILRPGAQSFADLGQWGYLALGFYIFMIVYSIIFAYGIFWGPQQMKRLLGWATNNRLLRRFHQSAIKLGEDLVTASKGLKEQGWPIHLQAVVGTLLAWIFRFSLISCLVIAFTPELPLTLRFQSELYARLQTMFFVVMFSPTPGGAGIIELAFNGFLTDYVHSNTHATVISTIWRLLSYYLYLMAGALVVPVWIRAVFKGKKTKETEQNPD